jgi:hypothetical protein
MCPRISHESGRIGKPKAGGGSRGQPDGLTTDYTDGHGFNPGTAVETTKYTKDTKREELLGPRTWGVTDVGSVEWWLAGNKVPNRYDIAGGSAVQLWLCRLRKCGGRRLREKKERL